MRGGMRRKRGGMRLHGGLGTNHVTFVSVGAERDSLGAPQLRAIG
jgi:hypothetical protein